jgi:hypothetical protein
MIFGGAAATTAPFSVLQHETNSDAYTPTVQF